MIVRRPEATRVYVDRGGTFTDVVRLHADGRVDLAKVPSDRAVVGALADGLPLTFGTTVATNALLERTGVPTGLLVTEGFEDLALLGDQARPALFDPSAGPPLPLADVVATDRDAPRLRWVHGVPGRLSATGEELEPLTAPAAELLERWAAEGCEAIAVALLHGGSHPAHERRLAAHVRALLGDRVHVAVGHTLVRELGYLARLETALVDAAITPVLRRALTRDRIPATAHAIRSDGSLVAAPTLRAPDAVLSGPAGGVLAVAAIARALGFRRAVGLDMGGTSTDVCRLDLDADDLPRREGLVEVAGVRLRRPMFEVETIAAGGGSVLASDGLRLTVGPASAGADPGPQCYGRGGPPTLTDAAALLGLVDPAAFDPPLDLSAIALPGRGAPEEFLAIAREAMAQAVRQLATRRGADLRDHALVSYGGAAGQHAAAVADRLGIETVLVHPCTAVLCAFGQALARREDVRGRAIAGPLDDAAPGADTAWAAATSAWGALRDELELVVAAWGLAPEATAGVQWLATADLRYAGTDHALTVTAEPGRTGRADAVAAFEAEHARRFGFARPGLPVELVHVRLRARAAEPELPALDVDPFGLGDGVRPGPAMLTAETTRVAVPEGWDAHRDRESSVVVLRRRHPAPAPLPTDRTPYGVELWGNRFMAVATEAGETLRRLARSVNIRERLDFSCALFDAGGGLVANAPHIPVHLGAMGETVRDLLRHHPDPAPGQAWLTNAPDAGGSHLPDLTVVTAVAHGAQRLFVACRGHHVDVGGLTPGSMPPTSRTLADEGVLLRHVPLLDPSPDGRLTRFARARLARALEGSRQPDTVLADLEAQVAANAQAAAGLVALGPPELVAAWMTHLADVADQSVANVLDALAGDAAGGALTAEDTLDGVPLRMTLRVVETPTGRELAVDLSGTGGPHSGNLNAPRAVLRAAVLYGLRVLVGREVPLNEGALRRVRLVVPEPSLVAPPPGAAVVGGNVETSQRLVDLFLRAAGDRAASQGTMNNLTLGGRRRDGARWSLYETLGGGGGATAHAPGVDGRQVHMTNTRATDPEVLEARLPLRVRRFGLRRGSGGTGAQRGGVGLVRELEAPEGGQVALLATRRHTGSAGLAGGGPGAPGDDAVRLGPAGRAPWTAWDGRPTALPPGGAVRVSTPGGGGHGPAPSSPHPESRP